MNTTIPMTLEEQLLQKNLPMLLKKQAM